MKNKRKIQCVEQELDGFVDFKSLDRIKSFEDDSNEKSSSFCSPAPARSHPKKGCHSSSDTNGVSPNCISMETDNSWDNVEDRDDITTGIITINPLVIMEKINSNEEASENLPPGSTAINIPIVGSPDRFMMCKKTVKAKHDLSCSLVGCDDGLTLSASSSTKTSKYSFRATRVRKEGSPRDDDGRKDPAVDTETEAASAASSSPILCATPSSFPSSSSTLSSAVVAVHPASSPTSPKVPSELELSHPPCSLIDAVKQRSNRSTVQIMNISPPPALVSSPSPKSLRTHISSSVTAPLTPPSSHIFKVEEEHVLVSSEPSRQRISSETVGLADIITSSEQEEKRKVDEVIETTKSCKCLKSHCLKLYCDCFAQNSPCGDDCKCQ